MSGPLADDAERVGAPTSWHGAILAGGAARRFGSDKVFAEIAGHRLIDLAAASLGGADGISALLGARDRGERHASDLPPGVTSVPDDLPGRGPLAGLATVLGRHPTSWIALLAADVPLVPRCWWTRLAAEHRAGALAIVPRDADGRWEPVAAMYHGSLATEAAEAVASGDPRRLALHPWLVALESAGRLVSVPTERLPADALLNVNRPSDVDAVAAVLRSRRHEPSG